MTDRRRRRLTGRLLAVVLVLWAVAGWSAAVHELARRVLRDPPRASRWHLRPDSPRLHKLRNFLAAVDARLPAPATIAVAMPRRADEPDEGLFQYLWVAYLLPRHEVLPPEGVAAARPRYWASYLGAGALPAGAVEIARWPEGALYRLRRRGRAAPEAAPTDP